MDCTLIPARARRLATFASSPGRSISSRLNMSLSSYFRPEFDRAFSVVCTSEVTTRRYVDSCFDSLAMARMLTAAFARASVTRASSPGLSATNTLNTFILRPPSVAGGNRRGRYKRLPQASLSRDEPDAVVREEDRFPDVRQVEKLLDEPDEAEPPAAVRRHAVPERLEIKLEVLWVQSLFLDFCDEMIIAMLPLATGRHFVPLVLEIERMRILRFLGLRHHVERLDPARIFRDEIELMAVLRHRLPENFLRFRVEVVSVPKPPPNAPQDFEPFRVRHPFEREPRTFRLDVQEFDVRLRFGPDALDR